MTLDGIAITAPGSGEPRRFRVHTQTSTQDCLLHPDGAITTVFHGNALRCAFTFDEMVEMDWSEAQFEWDPPDWEVATVHVPEPAQATLDSIA